MKFLSPSAHNTRAQKIFLSCVKKSIDEAFFFFFAPKFLEIFFDSTIEMWSLNNEIIIYLLLCSISDVCLFRNWPWCVMVLYEEKIYKPKRTFEFQNVVPSDFVLPLSYTLNTPATSLSEDKKKLLKKTEQMIYKTSF